MYAIALSHAGNPDLHGGYRDYPEDPGLTRLLCVAGFGEASRAARAYIERNHLGGGNWTGGAVYRLGDGRSAPVQVARVSYNGRVWDMAGKEIACRVADS